MTYIGRPYSVPLYLNGKNHDDNDEIESKSEEAEGNIGGRYGDGLMLHRHSPGPTAIEREITTGTASSPSRELR